MGVARTKALVRSLAFRRQTIMELGTVAGSRIVSALLQAGTLIYLARDFGAVEFGRFGLLIGIGTVAGSLLGFGGSSQALRAGVSPNPNGLATTLVALRLATAVLVSGAIALTGFHIGWHVASTLAAVYVTTELLSEILTSILLGRAQYARAGLATLLRRLIPATSGLLALILGQPVSLWLTIGWLLSLAPNLWMLLPFLGRPASIPRVINAGRHYWFSTAVGNLQQLDTFVVSLTGNALLVGHFAVATRLASPLNLLANSALSYLTPRFSSANSMDLANQQFRKARALACVYTIALIMLSPAVASLAPIVLGADYEGSQVVFIGTLCAASLNGLCQLYIAYAYSRELAMSVAKVRLWVVPSSLLFIGLGAFVAGVLGIAVAVVLGQIALLVSLALICRAAPSRDDKVTENEAG